MLSKVKGKINSDKVKEGGHHESEENTQLVAHMMLNSPPELLMSCSWGKRRVAHASTKLEEGS